MSGISQAELAAFHALATRNRELVREAERSGGDMAGAMNRVFDAAVVLAVWRKKRGGYETAVLKGKEHMLRFVETGVDGHYTQHFFDPGSTWFAAVIMKSYEENPNGRWEDVIEGGVRVGLSLV